MSYPAIEDHGLIGDLQTSALVAIDGTVDFMCLPRFDSPTVFASLLDRRRGGKFTLAPRNTGHVTKQMYLPSTAILVTRYLSAKGVAEVRDFMPIGNPGVATDRHRLIRMVKGIRGTVDFEARIEPRFDYARATHRTERTENGVVFEGAGLRLALSATYPLEVNGDDVACRFQVNRGETCAFILESGKSAKPANVTSRLLDGRFDDTRDFWRNWVRAGTYRGRWREAVERSAITLKLMTYAPSGAVVAAPTCGLPEQLGGERNWDYRFTWVRDASFSVFALLGLGFPDEARDLYLWLRDRIEDREGKSGPPLSVMYRVDGSTDLTEEVLDHLEGYRKSRPVRIGNGAADQLQLDVYGEALDTISAAYRHQGGVAYRGWKDLSHVLDWLCENWDQADAGIWETRGGRKPFTYGRIMSWVAFDRGIRMARENSLPADLLRWIAERDRLYESVMQKGYNNSMNAFVQYEGSDVLDASTLRMPTVGMVAPYDEKWTSTMAAMDKTLVSDSLVNRYDPKAAPDGLRGSEGTFSMCTFWYIDALTRGGRLAEARLTFEKMLTYGNHLGLFSEEIGVTGVQLGNFPQAFTHLALINSAVDLDRKLDEAGGPRVAA
jgi:GH15 family glucan-1,4-alpha-glucosidase